jgi:hypothetical protein
MAKRYIAFAKLSCKIIISLLILFLHLIKCMICCKAVHGMLYLMNWKEKDKKKLINWRRLDDVMVKIRKLEKQWTTGNERLSNVNPTKTGSVNSVFKTGVNYLHYVMLRVQNVRWQVIIDYKNQKKKLNKFNDLERRIIHECHFFPN